MDLYESTQARLDRWRWIAREKQLWDGKMVARFSEDCLIAPIDDEHILVVDAEVWLPERPGTRMNVLRSGKTFAAAQGKNFWALRRNRMSELKHASSIFIVGTKAVRDQANKVNQVLSHILECSKLENSVHLDPDILERIEDGSFAQDVVRLGLLVSYNCYRIEEE